MSKRYNIRWRDSDLQELQRTIKNYNAKLTRVAKKDPESVNYLPERMSMKKAKDAIATRADFNALVNSLGRFSQKGAEEKVENKYGAKATKWEIQDYNIKEQRENARRKREKERYEKMPKTSRLKNTGNTVAQSGGVKDVPLNPRKTNFNKMSQKEWDRAKGAVDKYIHKAKAEDALEKMKENYIQGLINQGFSNELQELVKSIDNQTFKDIVVTEKEAEFDFVYSKQELEQREDVLKNIWNKVKEKQENNQ